MRLVLLLGMLVGILMRGFWYSHGLCVADDRLVRVGRVFRGRVGLLLCMLGRGSRRKWGVSDRRWTVCVGELMLLFCMLFLLMYV